MTQDIKLAVAHSAEGFLGLKRFWPISCQDSNLGEDLLLKVPLERTLQGEDDG